MPSAPRRPPLGLAWLLLAAAAAGLVGFLWASWRLYPDFEPLGRAIVAAFGAVAVLTLAALVAAFVASLRRRPAGVAKDGNL